MCTKIMETLFLSMLTVSAKFFHYMEKHLIFRCQTKKQAFRLAIRVIMVRVIVFHQFWHRDSKIYYIHFVYRYLTN